MASLAMPTKAIRRTLRVLAHVIYRPMNLCVNMSACEQAPSSQFSQIFAWLVSSSNWNLRNRHLLYLPIRALR